jgi:2-iminobutanoate/2-iminopropanoate deaminase
MIERINPPGIKTFGAYSQAIKIDLGSKTMILLAGQIAMDAEGKPVAPDDIAEQTRHIFESIKTLLEEAGATIDDVVKAQLFLTDVDKFPEVSAVRNEYFAEARPVSTLVEISRTVVEGCDLEVEVMAIVDNN